MKTIREITALVACAFALASFGAGEGATQKWVKKYVEEYVAKAVADGIANASAETAANAAATASLLNGGSSTSSNGVNVIETKVGDDGGTMRLEWEDATVYALMVTNATTASAEYGITNGFVFVWNGDGTYVNGNGEIVKTYPKSETNRQCLTWHDIDSISTNGLEVFEGNFSVGGVMLQPSVAAQITNALTTASCRRSLWQMLGDLLMPAAMAQEATSGASDASMWYTPNGWGKDGYANAGFQDMTINDGSEKGWTLKYNTDSGQISGLEEWYKELEKHDQMSEELRVAVNALLEAFRAKQMVKTMAENLNNLFTVTGFEIEGKTSDNKPYTQTITFSKGALEQALKTNGGGTIKAQKEKQDVNIADERTISWDGNDHTLGLYGAETAKSGAYEWWDNLDFAVPCLFNNGGTVCWLKYCGYSENVFEKTSDSKKQLTLKGWDTADKSSAADLASVMTKRGAYSDGTFANYKILARAAKGGDLWYVDPGTLSVGGAPCDDASVTTNVANGAVESGKASVYGFAGAGNYDIPLKNDGKIEWATLDDIADGKSLGATVDDKDRIVLGVKGAELYAGLIGGHYFGTSQGDGAALGWWELPNVTTNMVVGDEAAIVAGVQMPGAVFDPNTKVVGLRGWNYSYNGDTPLLLVNNGGVLGYVPLAALFSTNGVDFCSNRWSKAVAWIGDGGSLDGDDGGIKFGAHGSLGSLVASYADGKSIEAVGGEDASASPTFRLKGWNGGDGQVKCDQTAAGLLNGSGNPTNTHEFLMRVGDGTLHYVPVGTLAIGAPADEATITTNAAASVAGKLAIKGAYDSANKDKVLVSTGSGIWWKDAAGGSALKFVGTDGSVGVAGSGSTTNTVSFASASDSNVKVNVEGSSNDGVTITIGVYYK